jgi:hypothetical protein
VKSDNISEPPKLEPKQPQHKSDVNLNVGNQVISNPTSEITMSEKLKLSEVKSLAPEEPSVADSIIRDSIETIKPLENLSQNTIDISKNINEEPPISSNPISRLLLTIVGAIAFGLLFGGSVAIFLTLSGEDKTSKSVNTQLDIEPPIEVVEEIKITSLDEFLALMNQNIYKIKNEGLIIYPLDLTNQGLDEAKGQGEIYFGANEYSYFQNGVMVAEDVGYYRGFIDEDGVRFSIIDSEESFFEQPSQFGFYKDYESSHPLVRLLEDIRSKPDRIVSTEEGIVWEWHHLDPQSDDGEVVFDVTMKVVENLVTEMSISSESTGADLGTLKFEYSIEENLSEILVIPDGYNRKAQVQQSN